MGKDKSFIFWYLAVTAILTVAASALFRYVWPDACPDALWIIPVFFVALLGLQPLARRITAKQKDVTMFFMAYRGMKFLISLILLLVYFATAKGDRLPFAITFAAYYLILMALETVHFIKKEKKS